MSTEKFVCLLYEIEENNVNGIDNASDSLFKKSKGDLEMLPPTPLRVRVTYQKTKLSTIDMTSSR